VLSATGTVVMTELPIALEIFTSIELTPLSRIDRFRPWLADMS
jgi:hypothetical protein